MQEVVSKLKQNQESLEDRFVKKETSPWGYVVTREDVEGSLTPAAYKEIKLRPYLADYFKMSNPSSEDLAVIQEVENWIISQIREKGLPENLKSFQIILREMKKIGNYTLNEIYNYIKKPKKKFAEKFVKRRKNETKSSWKKNFGRAH